MISQVALNDSQFDNRLICRSFQYYVDPDSESVVELGTKTHPYKDIGYAFVELVNYHSHTDRNITIFLKEKTRNFARLSIAQVINITEVNIKPYSNNGEGVPAKATITGINAGSLKASPGTFFNILKTFELRLTDKIDNNANISATEKGKIKQADAVFMVFRSNFKMDNIICTSRYSSIMNTHGVFVLIYIQEKLVMLTNLDFKVSGFILESSDPLNLHMENIGIDYYKNTIGVNMPTECNYPEAVLDVLIYLKNITLYYGQERAVQPVSDGCLSYDGSGDMIVEDLNISVWSFLNEPYGQLGMRSPPE